jgi:hypothetical protein
MKNIKKRTTLKNSIQITIFITALAISHFVIMAETVEATTYYVDAGGGDDINDGISSQTAWKSLEKVNSAGLTPGDIVCFKRGEQWRGQLKPTKSGNSESAITYTDYGDKNLPKPLILGSVQRNKTSDWVKTQTENVWETANVAGYSPLDTDIGNIIFNDGETCGYKVWSEDELTINKSSSTPIWIPSQKQGRFWYDEMNEKVKIYSTANPAEYYSSIELAKKGHIVLNKNVRYITFENLVLSYGGSHGFVVESSNNITIKNCDISFMGGSFLMYGDNDLPIRYGNGIEFWNNAHDCWIINCRLWEIFDAALTNQGSSKVSQYNLYYWNNVVWNSEYSYEFYLKENSSAKNIRVENNTFVNAGYGWGHMQRTDNQNGKHVQLWRNQGTTEDFFIRNNIFYEATEYCTELLFPSYYSSLDKIVFNNNLYYMKNGSVIKWGETTYETLASFKNAFPDREIDSIQVNPKFSDINKLDFRLLENSPAIDAATDDGYAWDFFGINRPAGKHDIGAYEYDDSVSISVTIEDGEWLISGRRRPNSETTVIIQDERDNIKFIEQQTSGADGLYLFRAFLKGEDCYLVKVGDMYLNSPLSKNVINKLIVSEFIITCSVRQDEDTIITASSKLSNHTQEEKEAWILLGIYEDNRLVDVAMEKSPIVLPDKNEDVSVEYFIDNSEDKYTFKAFVWENLTTMKPLVKGITGE